MTATETAPSRRDIRIDEIVDIAASLFARSGYTATGVSELCEVVGLGRGALYYYIGSKEGVLVRIHDRVLDLILPRGRAILALDVPADEKLRLFGESTIGAITRYPDHCWVFMHEWRALTGEAAAAFRKRRREYEKVLAAVLREGVEQGLFRIPDLRLAVLAWFGMHNYTYQWFRQEGRLDSGALAGTFHRLFLDGISAR
jgi:AcrR family transcriptional regulator